MKKTLLLSIGLFAGATCALAQSSTQSSIVFTRVHQKAVKLASDVSIANDIKALKQAATASPAQAKTTAAPFRYYNQSDALVAALIYPDLQDQTNLSIIPMWHDSTVRVNYSNGISSIDFSSINQHFNPIVSGIFNDPDTYLGEMLVRSTDAYRVDSVIFFAGYIRLPNKASVVDTLIVSVAPDNGRYALTRTGYPAGAPYLPAGRDTLYAYTVLNVDSINRAAFSGITASTARAFWKVPLTASMGDPLSSTGGVTLRRFAFAVPNGGLNIPAGNGFNVTATFKTGDTWVRNVDTISQHNSWRPVSYGSGSQMPYYYYDFARDRNMSGLMFSTDTSSYIPSILVESFNTHAFDYEFHDITAYVNCATCPNVPPVGVNDINKVVENATVIPNPANGQAELRFTLAQNADVNVTLTNAVGQIVTVKQLGSMKAGTASVNFDVSALPSGVYMYTVEAGSARFTNRLVVAH